MLKFYLFISIILILPYLNLCVTEEEKSDCVDIALINFNRECKIGKFRVPCYNGTRVHRHDRSIHQISFDSLTRIAEKCCNDSVCNLNLIRTEICCKKSECQQLCFGSGPFAHVNTYQVKYILDMEMPQSLKDKESKAEKEKSSD